MSETRNGTNVNVVGIITGTVAIISAIAAVLIPMRQSVENLYNLIDKQDKVIEGVRNTTSPEAASKIAEFGQQFVEIETQFKWVREVQNTKIEHLERRISVLEKTRS